MTAATYVEIGIAAKEGILSEVPTFGGVEGAKFILERLIGKRVFLGWDYPKLAKESVKVVRVDEKNVYVDLCGNQGVLRGKEFILPQPLSLIKRIVVDER